MKPLRRVLAGRAYRGTLRYLRALRVQKGGGFWIAALGIAAKDLGGSRIAPGSAISGFRRTVYIPLAFATWACGSQGIGLEHSPRRPLLQPSGRGVFSDWQPMQAHLLRESCG